MSFSPHTDGASEFPIAEISYPIGDDSTNTEIRMLPGMPVWLAFRGGDERYPIIVGNRPVNTGNEQSTRRWNHDNIEWNADDSVTINAGKQISLIVGGTKLTLSGSSVLALAEALDLTGKTAIKGPVTQTGGDMTSDGVSVQEHDHQDSLNGKSSPPNK
ncbi:hypothetical protein [Pseudomonas gingeri]|uniref:hypothetical protein n=1 Tax=Pseudomonas gingeri TaxID=117681 RepID=UPI0015A2D20E|nr:hypothetical protein [Pseudomonas gingeri]NWA11919.1 hypothetical protein [Pseudomonas gingeri]